MSCRAVFLLCAAALLSACGGGGGTTVSSPPPSAAPSPVVPQGDFADAAAYRPDSAYGAVIARCATVDENGDPCGSLVVVEADDAGEAQKIADDDPYAKADLFASVDIRPYNWVFNKPGA